MIIKNNFGSSFVFASDECKAVIYDVIEIINRDVIIEIYFLFIGFC